MIESDNIINDKPIIETPIEKPESKKPPKASLIRRIVADYLDNIVLGILGSALSGVADLYSSQGWNIFWSGVGLLLPSIYFIRAYATSGQTLGKKLLKIRVVSLDGTPLTWRQGIWRYLGYLISAGVFGLGFLWAIWDKNNQAWHDKIAGTIVLRDDGFDESWQFLSPKEVHDQRRRWQKTLVSLVAIVLLAAGLLVNGDGIEEVNAMEPWPAASYRPSLIVPPDLNSLGLGEATVKDARGSDTIWREAGYVTGAIAEYSLDGETAVWVAALHYSEYETAREDYSLMVNWAEENCGQFTWVNIGWEGVIECGWTDAYNKTLLNGSWIIDIVAIEAGPTSPEELVIGVRDALAKHWETISQGN